MKEREAEYKQLANDPNYTNVQFNTNNGGLMATHRLHNFDKQHGRYEIEAQQAGYNAGYKVILEQENHSLHRIKQTDGTWNNKPMEVAACQTGTPSNIRSALKHCASKPQCKIAILVTNKDFSISNFNRGLKMYNGLKGTGQWTKFDEIICIQQQRIVHKISHQ